MTPTKNIDQPVPGVRVAGELDLLTAPQLDYRLLSQIKGRGGHVVVDLSAVTFLAAAGLGSLIRAREAATRHDTELCLTGVDHRAAARPLEITRLRATFAIHPSTKSVIAAVGAQASEATRSRHLNPGRIPDLGRVAVRSAYPRVSRVGAGRVLAD